MKWTKTLQTFRQKLRADLGVMLMPGNEALLVTEKKLELCNNFIFAIEQIKNIL